MTAADADAFVAPRHWEADVLLRDGRTAHIRPIRPDDAELLVDFYSRVSDQSKYYRFFSPMPNLSDRDVARFTQVDHVTRVAFVMLLSERMIALGSYEGHLPKEDHQGDPVEATPLRESTTAWWPCRCIGWTSPLWSEIVITATSPSRSGATSTTLPMWNSRVGELFRA